MKPLIDKKMPYLAANVAHSLRPIMERLDEMKSTIDESITRSPGLFVERMNEIMTPQRMEAFSESVICSLSAWVEANKNLLENTHKLEPLLNKVNPSEILDDVEILEKIDSLPLVEILDDNIKIDDEISTMEELGDELEKNSKSAKSSKIISIICLVASVLTIKQYVLEKFSSEAYENSHYSGDEHWREDMQSISESGMDFWDNEIDETWEQNKKPLEAKEK